MIINESGGGAGLNLKVVGGTAAPASPKENTVWVNTDTEISSYAFSATQPENPTEGMVWFATGVSSSAAMNIDKKNTVMLYPLSCKQYIDGSWINKKAQSYVDKWNTLRLTLYKAGDEFEDITKGWIPYKRVTLNKTSEYLQAIPTEMYSSHFGIVLTEKTIDFTERSTLFFDAKNNCAASGYLYVGVTAPSNPEEMVAGINFLANESKIAAVDISSLTGEYYPAFRVMMGPDVTGDGRIYEVWAE